MSRAWRPTPEPPPPPPIPPDIKAASKATLAELRATPGWMRAAVEAAITFLGLYRERTPVWKLPSRWALAYVIRILYTLEEWLSHERNR